MTRHQLLAIRKAIHGASVAIETTPDYDDILPSTAFWLGRVLGAAGAAIEQIDRDLEAGTPPRL